MIIWHGTKNMERLLQKISVILFIKIGIYGYKHQDQLKQVISSGH